MELHQKVSLHQSAWKSKFFEFSDKRDVFYKKAQGDMLRQCPNIHVAILTDLLREKNSDASSDDEDHSEVDGQDKDEQKKKSDAPMESIYVDI